MNICLSCSNLLIMSIFEDCDDNLKAIGNVDKYLHCDASQNVADEEVGECCVDKHNDLLSLSFMLRQK